MGPILFREIFKEKVWGGRNLAHLLAKELPPGVNIGESWELADLGDDCSEVSTGQFEGRSLSDLLGEFSAEISGVQGLSELGLLFKFLDAADALSVQVHPNKHEAWYVLAAQPGTKMYLGLKEGISRKEFEAAVAAGTVEGCLAGVEPQPGQCYYLSSGLTHALGAGIVVAEIQTTEQVTYRVYDWGRDRTIHVQQSLETIDFSARPQWTPALPERPGRETVLQTERFTIEHCSWPGGEVVQIQSGIMQVWMILSGAAHYQDNGQEFQLKKGQTVLIPASCNTSIEIDQKLQALATSKTTP